MLITKQIPQQHFHSKVKHARIPIDIELNSEAYTITADVPGFSQEDIEIEANFEYLSIKAKRSEETEENSEVKYLHRERFATVFSRKIQFGKPVNPSNAKTSIKDGVLTVYMPLSENAKTVSLKLN